MKSGRHPHHALTAVKVRALTAPGRYADGGGLYLTVDPAGAKRWILRTIIHGRGRTDMGLGSVELVSLAEAREEALRLRKIARQGGDPIVERRKARAGVPTFEMAARAVHGEHAGSWKNEKHAAQWISTLQAHAFPKIGARRVDQVGTAEVLEVLAPIWLKKPETARRVRQRLGVVLNWARAKGYRSGDNPVEVLRGMKGALPEQGDRATHHAALAYKDLPAFIEALRATDVAGELVKLAFELLILAASRTSEVLRAAPAEFDAEALTWTIPAERMKAGRPHVVPLTPRMLEIVRQAGELAGERSAYLFRGRAAGEPLSNMVFLMCLRRMGLEITAHGFRSTFRDWAAECTNYPRELAEISLAHVVNDKTQAAYQRSDLLERRRALMLDWERHCLAKPGKVLKLRKTA